MWHGTRMYSRLVSYLVFCWSIPRVSVLLSMAAVTFRLTLSKPKQLPKKPISELTFFFTCPRFPSSQFLDDFPKPSVREYIRGHVQVITIYTKHQQNEITKLLRYRRRSRGRTMIKDYTDYMCHIRKGDRLDPSEQLWDVTQFQFRRVPFVCVFWRMGRHDRVMHESPILHIPGVTPQSYAIDFLHGPLAESHGSRSWLFEFD